MERTLWVLAFVALFALCLWLMYGAWQRKARRQASSIGELPAVPADLGAQLLEPTTGLYLGSTLAPSWIQRITVGDLGFRATAELTRFERGILLERDGAAALWIPQESVTAVRTERGHAGKVMTEDGVLVIRWTLPTGTEVDTGFRGDDKTVYPAWTNSATGTKTGDENT
ncbi:PH-like domain-containing protein [Nocardia blacklockiae]|uniref:PH-like domain-containing protein n=1 Tax=Nocardia blacklockiae TaxID=480036 RepID=UPI00189543D7|nr:transporter [Nocardia blacklockiae]MBF6170355.1 transporter [Nocardia blacklockiae]